MTPESDRTRELIRVALVSPSDVASERDLARTVIKDVNKSLASQFGILIELRQWEDAVPGLNPNGPQGQIDTHLDLAACDLVVGIFSARIGTPTPFGETGSEREIRTAMKAWRERGRPDLMIYFDASPPTPSGQAEISQLGGVLNLKAELADTGLYYEYDGEQMFAESFRNHLTGLVAGRIKARGPMVQALPCFVQATQRYLRASGLAEVVGEILLQLPTNPVLNPGAFDLEVTLNVGIANQVGARGFLADVYLVGRDQVSGRISLLPGRLGRPNQVRFENVTAGLSGRNGSAYNEFRVVGLRANASQLGIAASGVADTRILAHVAISAPSGVPTQVVSPTAAVGIVKDIPVQFSTVAPQPCFSFLKEEGSNPKFDPDTPSSLPDLSFRVRFEELYAGDFRTADEEAQYRCRYEAEPAPLPYGTRFLVRFSGVPANVRLFATIRNLGSGAAAVGSAVYVRTDAWGANYTTELRTKPTWANPAYPFIPLHVEDGQAHAAWEWYGESVRSGLSSRNSVEFGIAVVARPGESKAGTAMVGGSLAPLSQVGPTTDQGAPVPRFVLTHSPVPAFTVL